MSKGIKTFFIIICCLLLLGTMGAAFRVKNETPNENKPSTENSTSESTGDNSSTNNGDVTPDENGNFPYYSGDGEVFQDDYVYINPEKATVKVGDKFRLKVISTDNSMPMYNVFGGSEEIIHCDDRGNVTALAAGDGNILVELSGKSYLIRITVEEV